MTVLNRILYGRPERPAYPGPYLGRGYWRWMWNDIQRRFYLDRCRHPRELTWRDWLAHGRLVVMNLGAVALTGAVVYWCLRPFSPHWAATAMDFAVGGMLADWWYGKYRRERPPVRQIQDDVAQGELLKFGMIMGPAARRP